MDIISYSVASALLHLLVQLAFIVRVIIRPHRQPASRIAWVVVILALPIFGMLVYILFGEINIGRQRIAKLRNIFECMPDFPGAIAEHEENLKANIPDEYQPLFRVAESINHFNPVGGNTARLMADSNAAIDSMVADIDNANIMFTFFFISGCPMVMAVKLLKH